MANHEWKDHTIQVQAFAVAKMLWFGVGLEVLVDGKTAGVSPGRFEGLNTRAPFQVRMGESLVGGYVESGKLNFVFRTTYRIVVENQEIASGSVVARNWYMTYVFLPAASWMLIRIFDAFV